MAAAHARFMADSRYEYSNTCCRYEKAGLHCLRTGTDFARKAVNNMLFNEDQFNALLHGKLPAGGPMPARVPITVFFQNHAFKHFPTLGLTCYDLDGFRRLFYNEYEKFVTNYGGLKLHEYVLAHGSVNSVTFTTNVPIDINVKVLAGFIPQSIFITFLCNITHDAGRFYVVIFTVYRSQANGTQLYNQILIEPFIARLTERLGRNDAGNQISQLRRTMYSNTIYRNNYNDLIGNFSRDNYGDMPILSLRDKNVVEIKIINLRETEVNIPNILQGPLIYVCTSIQGEELLSYPILCTNMVEFVSDRQLVVGTTPPEYTPKFYLYTNSVKLDNEQGTDFLMSLKDYIQLGNVPGKKALIQNFLHDADARDKFIAYIDTISLTVPYSATPPILIENIETVITSSDEYTGAKSPRSSPRPSRSAVNKTAFGVISLTQKRRRSSRLIQQKRAEEIEKLNALIEKANTEMAQRHAAQTVVTRKRENEHGNFPLLREMAEKDYEDEIVNSGLEGMVKEGDVGNNSGAILDMDEMYGIAGADPYIPYPLHTQEPPLLNRRLSKIRRIGSGDSTGSRSLGGKITKRRSKPKNRRKSRKRARFF